LRGDAQQSDGTIVHELILIFTDLFITEGAASPQSVPALPALSALLTRGKVEISGDWRGWVLRDIAGREGLPVPVAAISRHAALPEGASRGANNWWLAAPVHLGASLTHVHMSARPVSLSSEEWRMVAAEFNRLFAADGFQLSTGTDIAAFLATSRLIDAQTTDPMRVLGQDVEPALPRGPDGKVLRRLMTGVQMWLHDHPLNETRRQRGEPAVNGFWIWGGGPEPAAFRPVPLPRLVSADPYLLGLWRLMKGRVDAEARHFAALGASGLDRTIVTLECARSSDLARRLDEIDRQWMAPVLQALRDGRLESLVLHLNDRLLRLGRFDAFRFWRTRRHWLEAAA
jgi:hypothetical protein